MRLLVGSAHPTISIYAGDPHIGRLVVPDDCSRVDETAALMPWAADNAAFSNFDARKYDAMLDKIKGAPNGLFVTLPDVVGDAIATAELFSLWLPALDRRGLPVALVAQDGLEDMRGWLKSTWKHVDALFIGGTTEWKMGTGAAWLVQEAKARDKWVHMGRVNSTRRLMYAQSIGCDSADGSSFSKWRNTYVPRTLRWLATGTQLRLVEEVA